MATLDNKVNPLDWQVPIVDTRGAPTVEFQRKWNQQARTNASIPDLTTAKAVSAVIDIISSTVGSLLVRGQFQWTGLAPSADGKVLRDKGTGAAPIWDTISSILDTLGAVQGDVLYRDAAAWKTLAPGTAGQVLTAGGPAANPAWTTPSSGGGGAASVQDDGTNLYVALSDADGQLVLDGSGDPVFSLEVLPKSSIPAATAPTFTYLTAVASSNYSPPAGCTRIEVELKAGGGGAGAQGGANTGADGGDASFNAITAKGGKGASTTGFGVPGDGGTGGVGTVTRRIPGEAGSPPSLMIWTATNDIIVGGRGGGKSGKNVGGGVGGSGPNSAANSGAGGTGANTGNDTQANLSAVTWSAGGGEGETAFFSISNPVGPYAYVIPDGGAGGIGSSFTGGKGGSGYALIKEFYD